MKFQPNQEITDAIAPIAEAEGVEIVDVTTSAGANPSLTIVIDTPCGVDLDTCERFHHAVDGPLDELDPSYGESYTLNVSSPGLDRPFKTARDFERAMGESVEVRLYAPLKGKKLYEGELTGYDGNTLTLNVSGSEVRIEMTRVAKVNKSIIFED